MNTSESSTSTRLKVGIYTLVGLALIGAVTVFVNDRPYWWRSCQLVHINVEDATGLKTKSPIRSLGLQIGYLQSVELSETHVRLAICITAPVEVLPATRAYIRGEGFLGDKFVELKPVKYVGETREDSSELEPVQESPAKKSAFLDRVLDFAFPSAYAAPPAASSSSRNIPVGEKTQDVQRLVEQVDGLVSEMTDLTTNLKEAIKPEELRKTMLQLNKTLENASRTLSPEGGLNTTAQRTLAKLEDAIEQLRDLMTRVNKGEGSVGMLLNDPTYAEEIREAIKNVNRLLSKVGGVQFVVNLGAENIRVYDGTRGFFQMYIYPDPSRYYLIGLTFDPRGGLTVIDTTTESGGNTTRVRTTQVEQNRMLFTAMLGKVFWRRLDLSAGALHGDGAASVALRLGLNGLEEMLSVRTDLYSRGQINPIDNRVTATFRPTIGSPYLSSLYFKGGLEGIRKVNGKVAYLFGAGIAFSDQDIKLLFTLR
jgi:hypothetical protein